MLAFYPSTTSYHHHQHRIPSRHRCNPFQRPSSSYEYHTPSLSSGYEQYAHQLEAEEARHTAYAAALHRERAKLEREVAVARAMEHARLSQFATPEFSSSFLHHSHENRDEGLVTLGDLEALLRARDRRQAVQEAQSQRKKQLLEEQQRRLKFALEARERERRLKEEVERQRQQQRQQQQQQQQQQKDLYEQLHRLMTIDFGDIWSHPENRDSLSRKNAMKKPSESSAAGPSVARKDDAPTKPTPTPATSTYDARLTALTVLDSLSNEYDSLISSFTFPTSFEAVPSSTTPVATHKLTYSPLNALVLAFEDSLMRLLQKLDSVESNGEEAVREVRRSLVKKVEKYLEALESRKEELWSETEAGKEESSIKGKSIDRSAYPSLKSELVVTLAEPTPVVAVTSALEVDEDTSSTHTAVPASVPVDELADYTRSHEDVAGEVLVVAPTVTPTLDSELETDAGVSNNIETNNDSPTHSTPTKVDALINTSPVDGIQHPDEDTDVADTGLRLDVPIIASSNLVDELVPTTDQYVVPTTDFDTTTLERTTSSAGDETTLGGENLTTYDFEMQDESSSATQPASPPSLSRIYTSSTSNSDSDSESEVSVDSDTSLVRIEEDAPTMVDKTDGDNSVSEEDGGESVDEEDAQNFVVVD